MKHHNFTIQIFIRVSWQELKSVYVCLCVFFCIYNILKVEFKISYVLVNFWLWVLRCVLISWGQCCPDPFSEVKSGRKPAVSPLYIAWESFLLCTQLRNSNQGMFGIFAGKKYIVFSLDSTYSPNYNLVGKRTNDIALSENIICWF